MPLDNPGSAQPGNQSGTGDQVGTVSPPADGGTPTGPWHIGKLCKLYGFSQEDAQYLSAEFDKTVQGWFVFFGGKPEMVKPQNYLVQEASRPGDPTGATGWFFSFFRGVYFSIETVPVLNDPRLWKVIDQVVFSRSQDGLVQRFLATISEKVLVNT